VRALPFDASRFRDVSGACGGRLDRLRLGSVGSLWVGRDLCLQSRASSSADGLSGLLDAGSVLRTFHGLPLVLLGGRRGVPRSHEVWKRKGKEAV
jgi:hypothetical protein